MKSIYIKIFINIFIIHFLSISAIAQTNQTIHLVYVLNSKDTRLTRAIQQITYRLDSTVEQIKLGLNSSVNKYYVSGAKFNSEAYYNVVAQMDINPLNDIVILCVLSHGFHTDPQHQYPTIQFNESDKRPFLDLMNLVLDKRPAYLLSIVNACNQIEGQYAEFSTEYKAYDQILQQYSGNQNPYSELFKPRLTPLAVTYLATQVGGAARIDVRGGKPFIALMSAFDYWSSAAATELPTWEKVLFRAQLQTLEMSRQTATLQCPYLEIATITFQNGTILRRGGGLELCQRK